MTKGASLIARICAYSIDIGFYVFPIVSASDVALSSDFLRRVSVSDGARSILDSSSSPFLFIYYCCKISCSFYSSSSSSSGYCSYAYSCICRFYIWSETFYNKSSCLSSSSSSSCIYSLIFLMIDFSASWRMSLFSLYSAVVAELANFFKNSSLSSSVASGCLAYSSFSLRMGSFLLFFSSSLRTRIFYIIYGRDNPCSSSRKFYRNYCLCFAKTTLWISRLSSPSKSPSALLCSCCFAMFFLKSGILVTSVSSLENSIFFTSMFFGSIISRCLYLK